jgi:hypothetical protein
MTDAEKDEAEGIEQISGLDDLFYDITVTDESTGQPLTSGVVIMRLSPTGTKDQLNASAQAEKSLTHAGAGRWIGTHDDVDVIAVLSAVKMRALFDRVVIVNNLAARKVATCRRVPLVDDSAS